MDRIDKLIITHRANILAKYGKKEKRIIAALNKLVKASQKQGLTCRLFYVDDTESMKGVETAVVSDTNSYQQFKDVIDALYMRHQPEYILIAGAQDIIPFQSLKNPAWRHDDELEVPSDLPYACDEPFNTDVRKFLAPTRVIGRLPDVPGSNDPSYFEQLVENITGWVSKDLKFYKKYFGLSTVSWQGSSSKNMKVLFGEAGSIKYSPLSGPTFNKTILKAPTHFINCHGALEDPNFYGEKGDKMPEALSSATLTSRITRGGIVAAECCYGAQLFDEAEVGEISIANNYLLQGAVAFLGSTNIAYGPADDLALADLITQYFLSNVFAGASTGSALLEARIKFLQDAGPYLDVVEIKTIAQFILLGDPSIHPVKPSAEKQLLSRSGSWTESRENRRENLKARGRALAQLVIPPVHTSQNELPLEVQPEIKRLLKANHMTGDLKKEVYLNADPRLRDRGMKASAIRDVKFIIYSTAEKKQKITRRKILVIKKKGLKILGSRLYVSR